MWKEYKDVKKRLKLVPSGRFDTTSNFWMHFCSFCSPVCVWVWEREGERGRGAQSSEFPVQWVLVCTALIYSMIQHKRASHADIDLPFLVLGCVCVFGIAWTLPFPSVRLYNPNQLHMLSWFEGVCVCVCMLHRSCPRCFYLFWASTGGWEVIVCLHWNLSYSAPHSHIPTHIKRRRI